MVFFGNYTYFLTFTKLQIHALFYSVTDGLNVWILSVSLFLHWGLTPILSPRSSIILPPLSTSTFLTTSASQATPWPPLCHKHFLDHTSGSTESPIMAICGASTVNRQVICRYLDHYVVSETLSRVALTCITSWTHTHLDIHSSSVNLYEDLYKGQKIPMPALDMLSNQP